MGVLEGGAVSSEVTAGGGGGGGGLSLRPSTDACSILWSNHLPCNKSRHATACSSLFNHTRKLPGGPGPPWSTCSCGTEASSLDSGGVAGPRSHFASITPPACRMHSPPMSISSSSKSAAEGACSWHRGKKEKCEVRKGGWYNDRSGK